MKKRFSRAALTALVLLLCYAVAAVAPYAITIEVDPDFQRAFSCDSFYGDGTLSGPDRAGYTPEPQDAFALRLPDPTYHPLPKYPGVSRDLAIVCDENITVAQAEAVISAAGGKLLRSVKLFDVYRGIGVPENKKSLAFSLELRADDRTLTDADSEGTVAKILAALAEKLNATLR